MANVRLSYFIGYSFNWSSSIKCIPGNRIGICFLDLGTSWHSTLLVMKQYSRDCLKGKQKNVDCQSYLAVFLNLRLILLTEEGYWRGVRALVKVVA